MKRVLVAHASKYGSTAEIAEAIGTTLRERGCDVDVVPAAQVRSIDDYGSVVVGSAVYMGRWRRPALRLLLRHRAALASRDVWLFNSGPVEAPGDDDERWLRPRNVEALAHDLHAHDVAVFGGAVSETGGFVRRSMARNSTGGVVDRRDWDEISRWALGIAEVVRHGVDRRTARGTSETE